MGHKVDAVTDALERLQRLLAHESASADRLAVEVDRLRAALACIRESCSGENMGVVTVGGEIVALETYIDSMLTEETLPDESSTHSPSD
jgi:ketosteroid isomerase-like protein